MKTVIELIILIPLFIVFYQFYCYSITATGKEKQNKCLALGIVSSTVGITSLAYHTTISVFGGLILIMFGLRLIAHGLDRIDKKIFIDRYDDDNTPG
ncbi:hypothetical protein KI809_08775 [Geobacter pelophilus]|jgi:hypothetical protein|uniref:Uncharacterized protein n=1 Tax=Geoanaerobacter pelophilus TaxID=60036 RepID=A0AAW4L4A8_9BACT|nr:hypothetical protein [Geoanaerobacter pelophilus]MBT0664392.1 hypothetical protein [Geoanaerobacter pelophilus]